MTAAPGPPVRTGLVPRLVDRFEAGLAAPICLTWELTYACNLACVHCLSSSGRRDPRELTTAECQAVIDTLQRMQVFYDAVRGTGSYATAIRAMDNLRAAGFTGFKLSVVVTRHNISQLDELKALADGYGAQLRLTRPRPSGRGAGTWHQLHPAAAQQRQLYDWLSAQGEQVLTGDSFFHLAPYGGPLPGLNLCGAGRVVCLIDPVGDVYACPFAIHEDFLAGSVRQDGGFEAVWRDAELFAELRRPQAGGACASCEFFDSCRGGCMAAKFFTGLPLDGPDPECVQGHGAEALKGADPAAAPRPALDHSHRGPGGSWAAVGDQPGGLGRRSAPVPVTIGRRVPGRAASPAAPPARACDEDPLAGFAAAAIGREKHQENRRSRDDWTS